MKKNEENLHFGHIHMQFVTFRCGQSKIVIEWTCIVSLQRQNTSRVCVLQQNSIENYTRYNKLLLLACRVYRLCCKFDI